MSADPAFRETLPKGCPPGDALLPEAGAVVYRLVKTNPPSASDFDSWRKKHPGAPLPSGVEECVARAVSTHSDSTRPTGLQKIPKFKKTMLCRITLDGAAGKIKKTGGNAHYSWWPFAAYDILASCEVIR